jgi:hypothetical protein
MFIGLKNPHVGATPPSKWTTKIARSKISTHFLLFFYYTQQKKLCIQFLYNTSGKYVIVAIELRAIKIIRFV